MKAFVVLEDGTVFEGVSVGAAGEAVGEIICNTFMTGYQELLTNPEFSGQIVAMTYPLIGGYGVNDEDYESKTVHVGALVMRELCKVPSNWRMTDTLQNFLVNNQVVAVEGIDTRALAQHIRQKGRMKALVTTNENYDISKMQSAVTCAKAVTCPAQWEMECDGAAYNVAVIDLGVKNSLLKKLQSAGFAMHVYPCTTAAQAVVDSKPDGIILSGGPGNPKDCADIIENVRLLMESKIPMLGVGLGHQLMALAKGFDIERMEHAHCGGNYPVKHKSNGRTYITSQNHSYVVKRDSVQEQVAQIDKYNINDDSVEGLVYNGCPAFSVQFEPGADVFEKFAKMMGGQLDA